MQTKEERKKQYKQETYISAFEPGTLIPGILIAFLVGAVCMNIIGKLGTTPNTSLLGAIPAPSPRVLNSEPCLPGTNQGAGQDMCHFPITKKRKVPSGASS